MTNTFGAAVSWRLPKRISGLQLDYDANYLVYEERSSPSTVPVDGDPVGTWTDRTGSNAAVAPSDVARPTWRSNQINGRAGIEFNGTSQELIFGTNSLARNIAGWTAMVTCKSDTVSGERCAFSIGTNADQASPGRVWVGQYDAAWKGKYMTADLAGGTTPWAGIFTTRLVSQKSSIPVVAGEWRNVIVRAKVDSYEIDIFLDGVRIGWNRRQATPGTTDDTTSFQFSIGNDQEDNFWDGMINRVLFWNRALTDAELAFVNYEAWA